MEDRYMFLLSRAEHTLKEYIKLRMEQNSLTMTPGQMGILFLLKSKNNRSMSELSKFLHIDNSAITRLVDRLEKSRLVKRESNPDDRRQYIIVITPEGIKEISKAKKIVQSVNTKITEGFSENEINIFVKILTSFFSKFSVKGENNE
jgi:DNA-binding MarR family transcriptional regulator